jgi:NAD(P)-dependent dehydrogenase (short-subunit alcohol dehydrogenase family)
MTNHASGRTESGNPAKQKTTSRGVRDRGFAVRPVAIDDLDLSGKELTIIGGTNGLGRAIAQQALARGAAVTVVGRTLRDDPGPRLTFVPADLSSMREAFRVGQHLPVETADVVLFTNGIIAARQRQTTTEHLERDLAISYLSRLAILEGLAARLGSARAHATAQARVFVMGSPGTGAVGNADDLNSERSYRVTSAHDNTIAGNEILVLGAGERYPGLGFFGLAPFLVKTGIRSNLLGENSLVHKIVETAVGLFMQSPQTYAQRIVPLLFAPELDNETGRMFGHRAQPILPTPGIDQSYVNRFLAASDALLLRALDSSHGG